MVNECTRCGRRRMLVSVAQWPRYAVAATADASSAAPHSSSARDRRWLGAGPKFHALSLSCSSRSQVRAPTELLSRTNHPIPSQSLAGLPPKAAREPVSARLVSVPES